MKTIAPSSRKETIALIKQALEKRSGKKWSVTGGTGTAYGWLSISCPPARRNWIRDGENNWSHDPSAKFGYAGPADRRELATLLGLSEPVHHQGHSIPSSNAYWAEYIDRAEGRTPTVYGQPYWD